MPSITILPNNPNLLYSPGNVDLTATRAKSINPGAYLRALIAGGPTDIKLNFDLTALSTPYPQIRYRANRLDWQTATLAPQVTLTIPAGIASPCSLEVVFKSALEVVDSSNATVNQWSPQATAMLLTGMEITPATCSVSPLSRRPYTVLVFGDSITRGVNTRAGFATTPETDRDDASVSYAYALGASLNAEVGVIGFGGQGFTNIGSGNVPVLPTTYSLLWGSGPARDFAAIAPDIIAINQGTNDTTDITTLYSAFLSNLLSACPSKTRMACMRPFNGSHASQIQAAIAACSVPSRCAYIDTTGWFLPQFSFDGTHPNADINVNRLAPFLCSVLTPLLPVQSPSTVPTNLRGLVGV